MWYREVLLVDISKTTKTVDLVMTDSWSLMRTEKLNRAVRDYFAEERKVRKIIRPKILTFWSRCGDLLVVAYYTTLFSGQGTLICIYLVISKDDLMKGLNEDLVNDWLLCLKTSVYLDFRSPLASSSQSAYPWFFFKIQKCILVLWLPENWSLTTEIGLNDWCLNVEQL